MQALHSMNKVRLPFIRDGLINTGVVELGRVNGPEPLKGLALLDIGCGGECLFLDLSANMTMIIGF